MAKVEAREPSWGQSGAAGEEVSAEPRARRSGPRAVRGYRPALDGLRAVAVLAVLAYHGGLSWASGGLLGVDVFFVLSGFLITSLLIAEWQDRSTIALGAFWARRARRLLPGLFVLLIGVSLYAHFATGGDGVSTIRGDGIWTLLYAANWHYIVAGQSYFVQNGPPSPLLHTWSLAIEEQFYLIWPIVAFFVLRRFGVRGLSRVAAAGAVASAVEMLALFAAGASVDRLYYGTDTRAQAIMVGAFLATLGPLADRAVLRRGGPRAERGRKVVLGAGLAGAGFLAWAFTALPGSDSFLYVGGFLCVSLCSALVIASVTTYRHSALARALSLQPVVYVGRISYGIYLYHWPIFLYLSSDRTGLSGAALFLARCAVTLVVSVASYHLLERPIRERRFLRGWRSLVALPVAVAVALPLLVVTTATPADAGSTVASGNSQFSRLVAYGQGEIRPYKSYLKHHPVRVLIYGDSLGVTLGLGLHRGDRHWGVQLPLVPSATLGCDLDPNTYTDMSGRVGRATQGCVNWRHWWPKWIRKENPDVVMLLLGRWEIPDHYYKGHWVHPGDPVWDRHLLKELNQGVKILSARGANVMLLTFPYINPVDVGAGGLSYQVNPVASINAFNRILAKVHAQNPRTTTLVDLNRMLDPQGHYTSVVDNMTVRWADREHISTAGGAFLQPLLFPEAVRLGLAHDRARAAKVHSIP